MPAPSPIAITTASLLRLLKEESTYLTELAQQRARLASLKTSSSSSSSQPEDIYATEPINRGFMIAQQEKAILETQKVFGPLRIRIGDAVGRLEGMLEDADVGEEGDGGEVGRGWEVLRGVKGKGGEGHI